MITNDTIIGLIDTSRIDDEEKMYLTEIMKLINTLSDLPSDILIRLIEIFALEQNRIENEEMGMKQELIHDQEELTNAKNQIHTIDENALNQLNDLEQKSTEEMNRIDSEELHNAGNQKQAADMKRYQEILHQLQNKKS